MAFHSFNGRFIAGLALTGFMLAAAGCQSGGNGILGFGKKDTTPPPPPDPKVLASQLQAYCPKVTLRDGTAFFSTYAKGNQKAKKKAVAQDAEVAALDASEQQDDSAKVIYQASITDVSRDCNRANGLLTMKIGVAGKVVPGPMFSPGTITMPIRVAVMRGTEVLYSQLHQHQVQVTDPSSATQFVFTDSNVVVPEPAARDYQAFAGYDEGPPKKTDKKKAAATQ